MTNGDYVAITNSGSADTESAQSTVNISPGAVITKITVLDLTLGHTYAVRIDMPGMATPEKYLDPANGAAATNGGKLVPKNVNIDCRIPVPSGLSQVKVSTWADTASATCLVGLKWEIGTSGQQTFSDFTETTNVGTSETKIGTISVAGGVTLRQIVVTSRLGVGLLEYVRLEYAGVVTPQKYLIEPGVIYDAMGTEVQNAAIFGAIPIDITVKLPSNVSSVDIYALSQTTANTAAAALVWTAN